MTQPPTQPMPFGAASTAADVLEGIDLSGKLAVITGGYSGLGLETTRALAGAGARVVVPARRTQLALDSVADIDGVEVDELDLADLDSVRRFAERLLQSGRPVDVVINSAAIMACAETRVGPGWEAQLATNHLGHYALVNRLWPLLAAGDGARVVAVSTTGHASSSIKWHDIHFEDGYDKWAAYVQSKKANALFATHLDALGRHDGVRAFTVEPGYILTPLQRHLTSAEMVAAGWIDDAGNLNNPAFKSPAQGAATQVWAATSPQLDGVGGVDCADCRIIEVASETGDSDDEADGARLWAWSAELTGVDAFASTP